MQGSLPDFRRVYLALGAIALAWPALILIVGGDLASAGAVLIAMFTGTVVAIFGIPLSHLFVKHQWLEPWKSIVAGGAVGGVCSLPFVLGSGAFHPRMVVNFVCIGALHGAGFWMMAFWRNRALQKT